MPYGNYGSDDSAFPSGRGTDRGYGGATPAFGGGGGGGGFPGMGSPYGNSGAEGAGGGGGAAGMWMAIIQKALGRLEGRQQTIAAANAAKNDIPVDPSYMKPFLDQMASEGKLLADSKLGDRARAQATAEGAAAANARGLSGPLAASVQNESVNEATDRYNRWRMQALQDRRQQYMQLIQQYMQALEARRQAQVRAGWANREAALAKYPIGPLGKMFASGAFDNGWAPKEWGVDDDQINALGRYDKPVFGNF